MSTGEMFELRRQIHELRTDATIMAAALRAYGTIIEKRDARIKDLETELELMSLGGGA